MNHEEFISAQAEWVKLYNLAAHELTGDVLTTRVAELIREAYQSDIVGFFDLDETKMRRRGLFAFDGVFYIFVLYDTNHMSDALPCFRVTIENHSKSIVIPKRFTVYKDTEAWHKIGRLFFGDIKTKDQ